MSARIITGKRPEGEVLFAAVAPEVHHVEGRVGAGKFAALLAPFRSEEDAREALKGAGAVPQ